MPSQWSRRRMRCQAANVVAGRAARREVRPWRQHCSAMPRRPGRTRALMARPNKGAAHVDDLKGTPREKHRVKVILEALGGQRSVADACRELGVGPTQYANLRDQMLQGALDAMTPKPVGRPPLAARRTQAEVDELEDQLIDLAGDNALLQAKLDATEALRAGGVSKSPEGGKPTKKRPRGRR